jgi:hypothetical protein
VVWFASILAHVEEIVPLLASKAEGSSGMVHTINLGGSARNSLHGQYWTTQSGEIFIGFLGGEVALNQQSRILVSEVNLCSPGAIVRDGCG